MTLKYLPYEHNFLKSFDDVLTLFMIVAMESEEKALLEGFEYEELEIGKKTKIQLKTFEVSGRRVLVGRSGVGLVNAGVLLTMVAEEYDLDAVLQLGVGGALDKKLHAGDTVVSHQIIQHDSVSSREEGNLFIAPGELTLSAADDEQVDPVMKSDRVLSEWLGKALEGSTGSVYYGTILSGSEFAANTARKAELRMLDKEAMLVDMEAGALAQVARKLKISFAAAKTVADRAEVEDSVSDDYKAFLEGAASHSRHVISYLKS